MPALIGLFAGALLGHWLWPDWGAILGGLAGFFGGALLTAQRQRGAFRKPESRTQPTARAPLDARLADLERRVAQLEAATGSGAAAAVEPTDVPAATEAPGAAPAPEPFATTPAVRSAHDGSAQEPGAAVPMPEAGALPPDSGGSRPETAGPRWLWTWFTGGHAMTRIGVVVLFFGVAFLLRYFAEHFTIPIAVRLLAVAAVGVLLVGVGWRLAPSRPAYGWSLQGAGTGVLYLTAFAAYRLFEVLPASVALALLAVIAAFTVWLALLADAQVLAALALFGAFLAPVLTGADRTPLPLFSYFAVVNAAVLVIATRRTWRAVSLLGFLFTFVLGLWWGERFYRPAHFAVVEPFLVLFLTLYVAIVLLHARRHAIVPSQPLDGLLVFGAPLVAFALQAGLVSDTRYGAAWSAVALAVAYAVLAVLLRRAAPPGWQLLARLFAGLSAVFASLAVPFAFAPRVTAALWSVEGALVFWLGLVQRTGWVRAFGGALQLAAGALFLLYGVAGDDDRIFLNAFFAGAAMVALAGFATVRLADRDAAILSTGERAALPLAFAWSALWWLGAGAMELVRALPERQEAHAVLAWVAATALAALAVRHALGWRRILAIGIALPAAMLLVGVRDVERLHTTLLQLGWLLWPLAWLVHFGLLHAAERTTEGDAGSVPAWEANAHTFTAIALVAHVVWEASEWTGRITASDTVWLACAAALPAALYLAVVPRCREALTWPCRHHWRAYAIRAGAPVAIFLALWVLGVNLLSPGEPYPLPYAPLANPLDVTLAVVLLALFRWSGFHGGLDERQRFLLLGLGIFLSINGGILRAGHHWGDIPWDLGALLASRPLQASLTLAWTVAGAALMIAAARQALRPLWMVGAALLALVVVKLFLVDLGALAGLPRVVAFLGVGALLLLIGYVSPLPPSRRDTPGRGADAHGDSPGRT